jgi:hypothetical protein
MAIGWLDGPSFEGSTQSDGLAVAAGPLHRTYAPRQGGQGRSHRQRCAIDDPAAHEFREAQGQCLDLPFARL